MSTSLIEALEQVDLRPGNTYRCRVKGRWVEVRVLDSAPAKLAKPFSETDVLHEPWVELPAPISTIRCPAKPNGYLPFDLPSIPAEDSTP